MDDTALGFTDDGNKTIEELVATLENMAQTWERLLHFSGGSLNLSKCSWFTMFWDWKNGRPELRKAADNNPCIAIRHGTNGVPTPIKRQQLDEVSRILGVFFLTTLGDFSEPIRVMKREANTMAGRIKSPRLHTNDIRVFHNTMYVPSMRISLPVLAVDEEELAQIQSQIIPSIVQRLGFNRNLPTAIRFGPVEMGGLGLMDLRTE